MDKITEQYRKQFFQESREILEKVNLDILQAEADPQNSELMNSIFRGIHTIKGSAGTFDLEAISVFSHYLESTLSDLRDGKLSLEPELVDVILAGIDHIEKLVGDYEAGKIPRIDDQLIQRFQKIRDINEDTVETEKQSKDIRASRLLSIAMPENVEKTFQEASSLGLYLFCLQVNYTSELLENGYDPIVFLTNLKRSCTSYYVPDSSGTIPQIEEFSPFRLYLNPTVYIATALSVEDIRELTFNAELIEVEPFHMEGGKIHEEPLHEFVDSAMELLESMEKAVIDFETSGSRESLNEIFRVVHSFKGDADMVGLQEITVFAHTLETLLDRLRSGTIQRTFALVDVILQSVDYLRQSVLKLEQGISIPDFPPVFETLKQYASIKSDLDRKQDLLKDISPDLRDVFSDQAAQFKEILCKYSKPFPEDPERQMVVVRALKGLVKASEYVGLTSLQFHAEKTISDMEKGRKIAFSDTLEKISAFIDALQSEPDEHPPESVFPIESRGKESKLDVRSLRVDEKKVDHFTNLSGELLIARNTYQHLLEQLKHLEGQERITIKALEDNLHLFSRLSSDIHHGVMSLRMIPLSKIFQKFVRTVRDISRKQKKDIQLLTGGEDIEVDKKITDMLSDPLIHLIRNACDHGIETPEERKERGKPEQGMIIITASQEGSNLFISVVDDGKGIDRKKLMEKAAQIGLDIASEDDPALFDLVFMPGVSTATQVSELSGRGVGLDVVKTTAQSLGGSVRIISNEGKGTEVNLTIPTALGVDSVLFVEAGGTSYAIPLEMIIETLKLPRKRLKRAGNQMLFYHRQEVLFAQWLEELLKLKGLTAEKKRRWTKLDPRKSDDEECSVVIVKTKHGKFGIIVDQLKKNMDVAMKPLPGILAGIDIVSGVSIMGDGRVFLVLNPKNLI